MKRFMVFVMAVVLLLNQLSVSSLIVKADEEYDRAIVKVSNGDTQNNYEIIRMDGDIYFNVKDYEKFTNYKIENNEKKIGFQMGKKIVVFDKETEELTVPVLGYNEKVSIAIQDNEDAYVAASKILPWLNVQCTVHDGILEIIPDGTSLWAVLDELQYENYMFNLYGEYGNSISSVAGLTAMTTFDTIINLRWERLISADGTLTGVAHNASYYDYQCYVNALTEIAQKDTFSDKNAENTVHSLIKVNNGLGKIEEKLGFDYEKMQLDLDSYLYEIGMDTEDVIMIYDLTENWQRFRELISSYDQIKEYVDIFKILKAYELAVGADTEYREYVNWLADRGTGVEVFNKALDTTVKKLSDYEAVIMECFAQAGDALLKNLPDEMIQMIASNSMNDTVINTCNKFQKSFFGSIDQYMGVAKVIYSTVVPVASGYEGMAKVGVNESIQDYCWNLANQLQQEEMTMENIAHIRQSYVTALQCSKMCYEAMQDTMDVKLLDSIDIFKGEGLLDAKLQLIQEKIDYLAATIDVTENDSVEGKENVERALAEKFASVNYENATNQWIDFYSSVLNKEDYILYAFVYMNEDDIPELLVSKEKTTVSGTAYPENITMAQFADVYTYYKGEFINTGSVGSSFENLSFNAEDRKIRSFWGGSGYNQYIFYELANEAVLNTVYVTYDLDNSKADVQKKEITQEEYETYVQKWSKMEYIGFLPICNSIDETKETINQYGFFEKGEDFYGTYLEGASKTGVDLIENTAEDKGDYYTVEAMICNYVQIPRDISKGTELTIVVNEITNETIQLKYTENGFEPFDGEYYIDTDWDTGEMVYLYTESMDRVQIIVGRRTLYIKKDAVMDILAAQYSKEISMEELNRGRFYGSLRVDNEGYITNLIDISD